MRLKMPIRHAAPVLMSLALSCAGAPLHAAVVRLDGTRLGSVEIDAASTAAMRKAEVPGLGLAIFNDGRPVYLKTYGLKDTRPMYATGRSRCGCCWITRAACRTCAASPTIGWRCISSRARASRTREKASGWCR